MSPGLLNEWRNEWRLRRGTVAYVESLLRDPDADDLATLCALVTGGDEDRARWELRYARRALGVLVAQRDALDDRTGSEVAREVAAALHNDRHVATDMVKVAERQFSERLAAFREVLTTRRPEEGTAARLGRVLLRIGGHAGQFPVSRQTAIWRGVGIACVYVGGYDAATLSEIANVAGVHASQLSVSAALVSRTRNDANAITTYSEMACREWCNCISGDAIKITINAEPATNTQPDNAYQNWISTIEEEFKNIKVN